MCDGGVEDMGLFDIFTKSKITVLIDNINKIPEHFFPEELKPLIENDLKEFKDFEEISHSTGLHKNIIEFFYLHNELLHHTICGDLVDGNLDYSFIEEMINDIDKDNIDKLNIVLSTPEMFRKIYSVMNERRNNNTYNKSGKVSWNPRLTGYPIECYEDGSIKKDIIECISPQMENCHVLQVIEYYKTKDSKPRLRIKVRLDLNITERKGWKKSYNYNGKQIKNESVDDKIFDSFVNIN